MSEQRNKEGVKRALKQVYDDTVKEPVPTDFNKFIKELDK